MQCQNCKFFGKEKGDKEEVCQNTDVLQYDIIVNDNSVYCLKWQPYEFKYKDTLFKRGGKKIVKQKEKSKARENGCKRSIRSNCASKRKHTNL